MRELSRRASYVAMVANVPRLDVIESATFEQVISGRYHINSIDPDVFKREDVLPRVVLYSGIGGVSEGSMNRIDGKYLITAVVVEADPAMVAVHKLNHPEIPVMHHKMVHMGQTLAALETFLPRQCWSKTWVHSSNSCKTGSTSKMGAQTKLDTDWAIQLMQRMSPAVWTLEHIPGLFQLYEHAFPTAHVVDMSTICVLPQKRKRLILSNKILNFTPTQAPPVTVRDVLGVEKGWDSGTTYYTRTSYKTVSNVDKPSSTVTGGDMLMGAERLGDFDVNRHTPSARDRAVLQGFKRPIKYPTTISEPAKREMVAQCLPPPFAALLSKLVYAHQALAAMGANLNQRLAMIASGTDFAALKALSVAESDRKLKTSLGRAEVFVATAPSTPLTSTLPDSHKRCLGKHGVWHFHGEFIGWIREDTNVAEHENLLRTMPWRVCHEPPEISESLTEFHARRLKLEGEVFNRMSECYNMGAHDTRLDKAYVRNFKPERHFVNIHDNPDHVTVVDANANLQKSNPEMYGPYLEEGESYKTPRTPVNVAKACEAMGLNNLSVDKLGEKSYYEQLVYDHWVLFDDKLRAIKGVQIDLDLNGVKPIRSPPYRLSPVKVAAMKELVGQFVDEGIVSAVTSEWGFPALLVPKPKGGWRLVVDLRKLNEVIPHDTYEPPSCDLCLEWLAGKPCRSCMDCRWGFHQVEFSERTRKVIIFVTPFGTFCYNRLVMGYINATAEFQRHVNNTLGPLLWKAALSMVDDVIVGSTTLEVHRQQVLDVWTRLACRGHSLKPEKVTILQDDVEYLGHVSTPTGLRPTTKHIDAIVKMPPPLGHDGRVNKTMLRSFIGMVKYSRRYIPKCGTICDVLNGQLKDDADGI